jgi:hypothetical protein
VSFTPWTIYPPQAPDWTWLHMRPNAVSSGCTRALVETLEMVDGEPYWPYLCYRYEEQWSYTEEDGAFYTALVEGNAQLALLIRSGDAVENICEKTKFDGHMTCFAPRGHEGKHIGCATEDVQEHKLYVVRMAVWAPAGHKGLLRVAQSWIDAEERSRMPGFWPMEGHAS